MFRSAWQSASSDPTLPLGAAICFCTYRLFDKRRKRNPEGPYWGNSPVWGSLGGTIAGLLLGGLVSMPLLSATSCWCRYRKALQLMRSANLSSTDVCLCALQSIVAMAQSSNSSTQAECACATDHLYTMLTLLCLRRHTNFGPVHQAM